jgi:hypothetical protein
MMKYRHYFASLTVKRSLRLTVVDVFCFVFFARYGIRALPLMTFCSLFNFNARLPCEIRESVAGRKSVDPTFDSDSSVIDICKYLFFVLCILQTLLDSKRSEIVSTDAPSMLVYVDAHTT